ncbi:MAG: hypothetical protein GX175_05425 [Halanaerobiaceae bacterium]|jgi:hypothetical protein|nr:hypothetical protein [Halanaerobiaceae bacterium]
MIKIIPDIDKSCALAEVYLDIKPEKMYDIVIYIILLFPGKGRRGVN